MSQDDGGYDDDMFVSEPPDFLKCVLCTCVLRDPVQVLACGHKFCRVCFERVKTCYSELRCPLDREIINPRGVCDDKGIQRVIGDLKVKCSFVSNGCPWQGDLSSLSSHEDRCKYAHGNPFAFETGNGRVETESIMNLIRDLNERLRTCENSLLSKDVEITGLKSLLHQLKGNYESKLTEVDTLKEEMASLKERSDKMESLLRGLAGLNEGEIESFAIPQRHTPLPPIGQTQLGTSQSTNDDNSRILAVPREYHSLTTPSAPSPELDRGRSPSSLENFRLDFQYSTHSQPLSQEDSRLVPHYGSDPTKVTISETNQIDFKGKCTVSLPVGVVRPGIKTWYEVTFIEGSSGSFVGWAMSNFFQVEQSEGSETSLGECRFSYGFDAWDGKIIHNGVEEAWGKRFSGSRYQVLGVAANLVDGQILYGINGNWREPMGIAFSEVDKFSQLFPVVSERGEKKDTLEVNFGHRNFHYGPPDSSYKKLMDVV